MFTLPQNTTVSAIGQSMLWCPSDGVITNFSFTYAAGQVVNGPLTMYYSTYAGNAGSWFEYYGLTAASQAAATACQFGTAYPNTQANGLIYMLSAVSMASVTDGTSNTMLASERAHGKFNSSDVTGWNWWTSGNFGDTLFTTFYPMNPFNRIADFCCLDSGPDAYVAVPSSFHPGGANFGFADGSVKFLKDSVASWQIQGGAVTNAGLNTASGSGSGFPVGVSRDASAGFVLAPGTNVGVFQALSTRNGGEVVSSDQY